MSTYAYNYTTLTYDFDRSFDFIDMNHKLFCTFTSLEDLENLIEKIKSSYSIIYNKIFILQANEQNEYIVTYNIDPTLIKEFPSNTILVHRKKETNTLYTINALNELIIELNNGKLDKRFVINWDDYRNTLLLTKGNHLKKLKTSLHKVLEL